MPPLDESLYLDCFLTGRQRAGGDEDHTAVTVGSSLGLFLEARRRSITTQARQ